MSDLYCYESSIFSTTGTWSPVVTIPEIPREFHYVFNAELDGQEINGFIVEKTKKKRHKFKVYLDTDNDGAFTKSDQLIGKTKLTKKRSRGDAGGLLDGLDGQLEVDFIVNHDLSLPEECHDIDNLWPPPPRPICQLITLEESMVFTTNSRKLCYVAGFVVDLDQSEGRSILVDFATNF